MGENESNSKASNDSSSQLDEESLELGSLHSGSTSRQYPESDPSTSTHHEPLKKGRTKGSFAFKDARIFGVVASGDPIELSNLLIDCRTEVHYVDINGNTALHQAVVSVCRKGEWDDSFYQCIDLLMSCEEMNLNMPNKNGYTAIGQAVHHRHKKCIEHVLEHPSADRLYLDYYPGDSEYTVREIIMQTYPDLQPLLPPPLMESLDSSESDIKLLAALQYAEYNIFIETVDSNNPNPWYDEPYHSSLLEIACQMKNRQGFVEHLLVIGADPNTKNRVTGMPLVHATARGGNLELLEMLLKKYRIDVTVKDSEQRTILHWWARVSENNPDDSKRLESCFTSLLQKDFDIKRRVEDQDSSRNTPFSIAVDHKYRDRILLMLDTESDDTASAHINQVLQTASKSLLETILDYCFVSNDEPTNSEELKLTLKFFPLINMTIFAVASHHKDLLKHPVMSIFVNLMWRKLKYFFFLNVALYVTFLLSLTAYILFSEFCNIQNSRDVANNANSLLSHNDSNVMCGMIDERRYNISQGLWYALMILLVLLCVREVCQLLVYRRNYIMSKENWLELLLIAVTFQSCSGIVDSIEVNKHLFAFAILLGWFELVLLLGRLPLLSIQTEMFKTVSWTFLRFMAGYIILILAFAFSFYILFEENVEVGDAVLFNDPLISILKTIVMFAGEFEVSSLPFDTLPGTSHVIFLLFVFFVSIVLLNLLNGLAVGDTRKVREDAETLSIVARVKLITNIFYVFSALPNFMNHYVTFEDKEKELFLNKKKNIRSTDLRSLQRIINEKREKNKKEKTVEYVENWKLFAEKLSTLELESKETRQMLKKILTHLNIPEP
jgi:ankyrin repeat protein